MPYTYDIDLDLGLVVFRCEGRMSETDLDEVEEIQDSDPRFLKCTMQLADWSKVTKLDLSPEYLRKHAMNDAQSNIQHHRVALVVPNDLGYGLGRIYAAFRGDGATNIHYVRSIEEGARWLGIDPAILATLFGEEGESPHE